MTQRPISSRVEAFARATTPFMRFFSESPYPRKAGKPGVNDFAVGNPHELALPGIVTALQKWAVPQNERWFAYKISEPEPQEVVAASLRKWRGIPFEPADIALTIAGFAAIAVGLKAVTEPGDEAIFGTEESHERQGLSATGLTFQISSAYCRIVRSLETFSILAVLRAPRPPDFSPRRR